MKAFKKAAAVTLSAAMVLGLSGAVYAEDITPDQEQSKITYDAPTEPVAVDDSIITATAHRAASPVLGIIGVNAISGFGMINGGAPATYQKAIESPALGIWGSSLNDNPDPYYVNYFYNYYAAENGLETVASTVDGGTALTNANVAASPGAADGTTYPEYGNVSISLATRPDIAVGVASKADGTSTNGYDEQLATIHALQPGDTGYHEGDETYSPKLVSYQMTTIKQMIESVQRLADAVDEVAAETGKTTRYAAQGQDAQTIAANYENFVYGLIAYIHSELEAKGLDQKTFAFVTAVNEDGTLTVGGAETTSATSLGRAYEYCVAVGESIATEETTMTCAEVADADVIITINNQNVSLESLNEAFANAGVSYDGLIISDTPAALYGVTMNSVENANGYAYVLGSMYADELDVDPVSLCAYFYYYFLHISDRAALQKVVLTNFDGVHLPDGVTSALPEDYSAEAIEEKILQGMLYYAQNEEYFDAGQFSDSGIDQWEINYEYGLGTELLDIASSIFDDVPAGSYYEKAVSWALLNGVTTGTSATTFSPKADCTRKDVVTFLYRAAGSPSVEGLENPFTEVPAGSYYEKAVKWAVAKDVTTGTSATTFSPKA